MEKKRYFKISITAICLVLSLALYMKMMGGAIALAVNPGHSWNQMDCNSSNLCVDTSTSRVGVGTASPETNLHVFGGVKIGDYTTCDSSSGAWTFTAPVSVIEPTEDAHITTKKYVDCRFGVFDTRDGNWYPGILIGDQCWMAKNLAYLPSVVGASTGSDSVAYYYVYGYNGTDVNAAKATTNYSTYGVLYNWTAAQTACPAGWHLPTDAEQYTLENYLSTGACSSSRTDWSCDPAGTLLKIGGGSGFEYAIGGVRYTDGSFSWIGGSGGLWSSTPNETSAWRRHLNAEYTNIGRASSPKNYGLSVRCIKN